MVLVDAGYGDETAFRDGVTELGLLYSVGVRPDSSVWGPGKAHAESLQRCCARLPDTSR
jgi:SRSO17 transposase